MGNASFIYKLLMKPKNLSRFKIQYSPAGSSQIFNSGKVYFDVLNKDALRVTGKSRKLTFFILINSGLYD